MKKKIFKSFLKINCFILCTFLALCVSLSVYFFTATKDTKLDMSKFIDATNTSINIYDTNEKYIESSTVFDDNNYVKISELNDYTINAFIATEDRRFYSHHGIDLKRMISAGLNNLKNRKFSQGASTISQQLIKNTHLTQEKTMSRKLKEIKLAIELEHHLSKDEILEQYLNSIYFGNGAYGIENASKTYFNKSARDLTINESALLAGIIKAPSNYDPINKNQASEKRKKTVLKLMQNQGFISEEDYTKNANCSANIVKNSVKNVNLYKKMIISEICKNLNISENQMKNTSIDIITSIDKNANEKISNILQSEKYNINGTDNNQISSAAIIIENNTKNIIAVAGKNISNIEKKRQPGSCIKPIIAYAPAIENGLINPETIIKDEPINIGGYTPKNANKKYLGNVTVSESLQKSLNIPTVKILSNIGVKNAKNFAEKIGISFNKNDQNLALALGGMTDGITIKQLADAYSTFADNGKFASSNIIKEIKDKNGNILWQDKKIKNQAMKESTSYLITNMLQGTKDNGTTRRLSTFDYQIASKTGTVGIANELYNQDAYCAVYTSKHTIITWFGENEKSGHLPSSVNGSTYPTILAKDILNILYQDTKPSDFQIPETVVKLPIDTRSQQFNNKIEIAKTNTPERYKKEAYFAKDHLPSESTFDKPHKTTLKVIMNE